MTPRPRKPLARIRAIGYVRVSSQKQADSGLSLEHQEQKIRAMAAVHDVELQDVLIDSAESAASLDRPQVQMLLDRVRGREVDAVYIAKLDRLTRSIRDLDLLLTTLRKYGVALVSVSESLDTSTAAGRMVVNMLGVVGQWEREAIGERTSDALDAKRRRGERYGALPYGAQLAADGRTLERHDGEHALLRLAAECREGQRLSWQETADTLNRDGHRNRKGRPWTWDGVRSLLRTWSRHQGAAGASTAA